MTRDQQDDALVDLAVRYSEGELSDERFIARVRDMLRADCVICREKKILPSEAIACVLHSAYAIDELRRQNAALRDTAGVGGKLRLTLAEMNGCFPSEDGEAELASVRERQARLDRVRAALEHALAIANYEAES